MALEVLGTKFPVQVGSEGTPAAVTDPDEMVMESMVLICSTPKGELEMDPEFGIIALEMVFEPNDTVTALAIKFDIQKTVQIYEPRARIVDISFENDEDEPDLLLLVVTFINLLTGNTLVAEVELPEEE